MVIFYCLFGDSTSGIGGTCVRTVGRLGQQPALDQQRLLHAAGQECFLCFKRQSGDKGCGQGILAGPAAMYLFAYSIQLLGAARAAVFPAIVPALTL